MLTQKRTKELFDYQDGSLIRKTNKQGHKGVGSIAGGLTKSGYLRTTIDYKLYLNHRLVWLWHYGYFPENGLDHIDKDPSNNRVENLREVSRTCNARNCGNHKNNTSGVKGICWNKTRKRWMSRIRVIGDEKFLGVYKDFFEAVLARLAAEQCLEWEGCDSSSPAYQYAVKHKLIRGNR